MFTGMGGVHPFGGKLFVRKLPSELSLQIWDQDEYIYKQYLSCNMCWVFPNGEML